MMKRKHRVQADEDAMLQARRILQRGMMHNPQSACLAQVRPKRRKNSALRDRAPAVRRAYTSCLWPQLGATAAPFVEPPAVPM